MDSGIHRINHNQFDGFAMTYPRDSDLSDGERYPPFEQLAMGPGDLLRLTLRSQWVNQILIIIVSFLPYDQLLYPSGDHVGTFNSKRIKV